MHPVKSTAPPGPGCQGNSEECSRCLCLKLVFCVRCLLGEGGGFNSTSRLGTPLKAKATAQSIGDMPGHAPVCAQGWGKESRMNALIK